MKRNIVKPPTKNNSPTNCVQYSFVHECIFWLLRKQYNEEKPKKRVEKQNKICNQCCKINLHTYYIQHYTDLSILGKTVNNILAIEEQKTLPHGHFR